MYFLKLTEQHGYDNVLQASHTGISMGDLLQDNADIYLCLGDDIEYKELYKGKKHTYIFIAPTLLYRNFLTQKTILFIHRMVKEYFSSYKHVINLFIPQGIDVIIKKMSKPKKVTSSEPQTCILFPDTWSLTQKYPIAGLQDTDAILHGGMTQTQKRKLFWQVKNGDKSTIISTNRGLFYDWLNLQKIIIYNPSSRSYSSQSEPRFIVQDIAKHISEKWNIILEYK